MQTYLSGSYQDTEYMEDEPNSTSISSDRAETRDGCGYQRSDPLRTGRRRGAHERKKKKENEALFRECAVETGNFDAACLARHQLIASNR